jgi:hypothetical protein
MANEYENKSINSKFFVCSASVRRISCDAEPSLRNAPIVSFSKQASRIARAVFPVYFLECTNNKT